MEFVMSAKNHHIRVAAVDGDRHLHAVSDAPGQPNAPTTEDKVRAALMDSPGSTPAAVAMAAGVGRSTASKFLARWESEGTAIRTAGDSPRTPDTWALATPDHDAMAAVVEDAQPETNATPSAEVPSDHASAIADTTTEATDAREAADAVNPAAADPTSVQEPTVGSDTSGDLATDASASDSTATDSAEDAAVPPADADAENSGVTPVPGAAAGEPVGEAAETGPSTVDLPAVAETASTDGDRLPKGGLRALVEEYLTDHPGGSFGPAKIGRDLGRSGGAVNNALEKLVADGYAIKTCEAPKRFTINQDKTDVPATPGGADDSGLKA
ncbi:hypothetical protein ACQPXB_08460 [Amycolatopsis sp. CA-161197]|uniref:hypothetical protein n=1 Tax=Amycolatopsis sp. CA-161197 TaxID=3239922 RepID=UPI003D8B4DA0